jgi:hypothetical protein
VIGLDPVEPGPGLTLGVFRRGSLGQLEESLGMAPVDLVPLSASVQLIKSKLEGPPVRRRL